MRCIHRYKDGSQCFREVVSLVDRDADSVHHYDKHINQTNGTWNFPHVKNKTGLCPHHEKAKEQQKAKNVSWWKPKR